MGTIEKVKAARKIYLKRSNFKDNAKNNTAITLNITDNKFRPA